MNKEEAICELINYLYKRKTTYTKLDRHDKAIETVLKELEDNQADLTTVYIKGVCDGKSRWRDKLELRLKELEKNQAEHLEQTGLRSGYITTEINIIKKL